MRIVLNSIKLHNFKGIQKFEANLGQNGAVISGPNESGKTSVMDAWLWLLFDRDSRGYKGAEAAKTTAGAGYVHHLDHEVEAAISVDDKAVTLKKILRENWVKSTGQEDRTYRGNAAEYFIDDLQRSATEFKTFLQGLVPDPFFSILSEPGFFSNDSCLPWRTRLSILLDLSGKISDEQVAEGDSDLMNLLAVMNGRPLDDFKKLCQAAISKLNSQIAEVPIRIAEQKRLIQVQDWSKIEQDLETTRISLSQLEAQESDATAAVKPILAAQTMIRKLEGEMESLIRKMASVANTGIEAKNSLVFQKATELSKIRSSIGMNERAISTNLKTIDDLEATNEDMRREVKEHLDAQKALRESEFKEPSSFEEFACPTCKRQFPDEDIREKIDKMRADWQFNRDSAISRHDTKVNSLRAQGTANNAQISDLKNRLTALRESVDADKGQEAKCQAEIDRLQAEYAAAILAKPEDFLNDPSVLDIEKLITQQQAIIDQPFEDRLKEIRIQKAEINRNIDSLRSALVARDAAARAQDRIHELDCSLKAASAEKARQEGLVFQCDRFIKERTRKVEGQINALFESVSFKLFRDLINGGIEECCEAIVNNTTIGKANTGGQINADIDIIGAISNHKDIHVPLFVDHCESVTSVRRIDTQMILLSVAEGTGLSVDNY